MKCYHKLKYGNWGTPTKQTNLPKNNQKNEFLESQENHIALYIYCSYTVCKQPIGDLFDL